jgi:hypothetical protein
MISRTTIALAATMLGAAAANAQSVNYTKLVDDAKGYKKTMLYLDLFAVDTYLEPSIGSAVKLETVVAGRIMPWAQVKFALTDAASHHAVTGYPTVKGGQKKQLSIDLGGALYLVNKTKSGKPVKVVLSSFSTGRVRTTKYINVPAQVSKMFGPEGGVNFMRKAVGLGDDASKFYRYESMDGSVNLPIIGVGGSGKQPAGLAYDPQSMTNVMSVFAGIHFRKVTNLSIKTDGYGVKSSRKVGDFYVDAMIAPVVPIANVIDAAGQEWKMVKQDGAVRNLGWRMGYTHHNSYKVGFEYNFEVGQRPGPKLGDGFMDNGTYMVLGMGLSIGSKLGLGKKDKG